MYHLTPPLVKKKAAVSVQKRLRIAYVYDRLPNRGYKNQKWKTKIRIQKLS